MAEEQPQKKTERDASASSAFHAAVYRLAKAVVGPLIRRRYGLTSQQENPPEPYLILANHTTALDPALVALAFPHTYFALPKKGAGSLKKWLLYRLFAPITRTASGEHILNAIAHGKNVCLFPEGEATPSGETMPIPQSIADLVKRSGATLVTYRLEGGFLTRPVWARHKRRGKMRGYIGHIYPARQLGEMKTAELAKRIRADLWVDAYQINEDFQQSYCGPKPAEEIERVLHLCPNCSGWDTLRSENDRILCSACGLELRWNGFGLFETPDGSPPPFLTIRDWYRWQQEQQK